jgi:hypothetical protein
LIGVLGKAILTHFGRSILSPRYGNITLSASSPTSTDFPAASLCVEAVKLAVVAGCHIDATSSYRYPLRPAKSCDRPVSDPLYKVDHFKGTVGDAGDEQPVGQGIVSHMVDPPGNASPIHGPADIPEYDGSAELASGDIFVRFAGRLRHPRVESQKCLNCKEDYGVSYQTNPTPS